MSSRICLLHIHRTTRLAAFALFCLLFTVTAKADDTPDLSGSWQASLEAARYDPIELRLHISMSPDGELQATLDIPSQFRAGLPVAGISIRDDDITIRIPAVQAEFYGVLIHDTATGQVLAMEGDWNQSGEYVPLRLQRVPPDA